MGRRRIVGWEEEDVHTGWRRVYPSLRRPGATARAKRRTRRHERRIGERETRREAADALAAPQPWQDRSGLHQFAHRNGTVCLRHPETGEWWTTRGDVSVGAPIYGTCRRDHPADFAPPMDARGFVLPGVDW